MDLLVGQLRISFVLKSIDIRVIGDNGKPGVEEALAEIGRLERFLKERRIRHEAYSRRYDGGRRTDALIISVLIERKVERRRSGWRQMPFRRQA